MFCSQCGADNAAGAKFCAKCGTALATAPPPAPVQEVTTMRGAAVAEPSPVVTAAAPASVTGKNPALAVILSFFIAGLGQIYNGDWKKGIVFFVAAIVGFALTGGLLTLAVWIWGMVDAWQVASGKGKPW